MTDLIHDPGFRAPSRHRIFCVNCISTSLVLQVGDLEVGESALGPVSKVVK
jgi:hypothetical protein